jgi:ribosomal protein S18 acetylase RimI-like enzyme
MVAIRQMHVQDADAVREIDATAFSAWASEVWEQHVRIPMRTRANVLVCLEKDPDGCFVAVEDGRPVGFVFSRTWGGVGWFGTFAVLPEHQNRNIGRALIGASLGYLGQDPGRLIGLETMTDSPKNLSLYLRQGFQLRFPTLRLAKELPRTAAADEPLPSWSSVDAGTQQRWLAELRQATGQILPGLDYSKEILSTARHGLGEVLVLVEDGRAVGFSVIESAATREGSNGDKAHLRVMALHPAQTNEQALRSLLSASENAAQAAGKERLLIPVNGRHVWAIEQLPQCGYRVEHVAVHMVLAGTDDGPRSDDWVDCVRWAG